MTLETSREDTAKSLRTLVTRATLQRLAITLGALLIYRFGAHWPAPGIDPNLTLFGHPTPVARFSIFALGVSPILTIMVAAEMLKLAFPVWLRSNHWNRYDFNRWILIAGLALTGLQAFGIATGLEEIGRSSYRSNLVPEPGLSFRLQFTLEVIAGTALLVWLADQVTRYGVGSGLWIFLLAPIVSGFYWSGAQLVKLYEMKQVTGTTLWILAAAILAATALLVALAKAKQPSLRPANPNQAPDRQIGLPINTTFVWPPFIALTFAGLAASLSNFLGRGGALNDNANWFALGSPSFLALTVVLIFILTFMFANRDRDRQPVSRPSTTYGTTLLVAAAFSAICVTFEVLINKTGVPLVEGGWFAAIILVCLSLLPFDLASYFPEPTPLILEDDTPGST